MHMQISSDYVVNYILHHAFLLIKLMIFIWINNKDRYMQKKH